MKKLILPFVALLIGMAACQKEDTNVLTLEVEHYNGDAKMHIDNQDFAVWDDGDIVWLNETEKQVSVNNNHATISASNLTEAEGDYYASYPYRATMGTGRHACSITLPEVQTYRENSQGQQIVAAPMLAYCGYEENTLKFRNIGSVLAVKVMNYTYDHLRVHSIQVIANNQNLWGNGNVGLTGEASLFSYNLSNGGNTVTLNCGDGVEVPAEGKVFYIALPTISGAHLTVKVDDGYGIYTLAQTTNTATFARNTLHQVPFSATYDICEDYKDRQNWIKYTATSKLSGFEEGNNEAWGKRILHHDYDATSQQGTIIFNSDITELPFNAFKSNNALSTIELPESVKTIGGYAFYGCGSLSSVSMPGVTFVDAWAFAYCYALTTLNLSSVTSIGEWAFNYCTALTTVNLPSVTSIGGAAFYGSGIQNITFGPNLDHLGVDVFAYCRNITDIYCKAQNPPRSDRDEGSNCFGGMNIHSTPTLHVPSGKGETYANDDVWGPAFGNTWGLGTRIREDCPE